MAIVLAAHSVSRAAIVTADTDDGDGRAGQANHNAEVLDDDTQKADEGRNSGVASLWVIIFTSEPIGENRNTCWAH